MKLLSTLTLSIVLAFGLAAAWTFWGSASQAAAHDETKNNKAKASKQTDATYSYIAQAGDSYTKMARKAVQTYGLKHKINLTPAGIIFAETNLTRAAGSPELNVSQNVQFKESAVHEWVDKAEALSADQQAAWNFYVQFVDFNTNNVGQPS